MPSRRPVGRLAAAIIAELKSSNRVLSGNALARRLTARGEPVLPSQVFAKLHELCAEDLVHRVEIANGFVHGPPSVQANFVCAYCGLVTAVDLPHQFDAVGDIARACDIMPHRVLIEAAGTCQSCRDTERQE